MAVLYFMSFFRVQFVGIKMQLVGLLFLLCCASFGNPKKLVAQDRMPSTIYEAVTWLESQRNTVTKNDDGEVTEVIIDYIPDIFVVGDLDVFPKLEKLKINYTGQFYDRHMSGIARLKSLKVFDAVYCEEISEASISVLRYVPKLEEVRLKDCAAVYSLKSLAECRSLKKIDLSSNDHIDFEVLKSLRRLPKLESLVLDENESLEDHHLRWLKGIETLTTLSLVECDGLTDDAFEQLGGIPNLKKLVIRDNDQITGTSIEELKGETLEELELTDCGLNDESLLKFKHLKSLRKFDFSSNSKLKGTGLSVLENFKNLEELNLSGLSVTNDQLQSLRGIATLKTINLQGASRVSGIGLAALTKSESLKKLDLGGCRRIDSEDLAVIVKFKDLEELDLKGTRVKPEGLEQLEQLSSLKKLDLSSCNWINDAAMDTLARFPALQNIRLSKVQRLTDKAIENLAKSKTIKEIYLKENRFITGSGLASLAESKSLVKISLNDLGRLSAKGLGHLQRLESLEALRVRIDKKRWTPEHMLALYGLARVKWIRVNDISELEDGLYQGLINSLPMHRDAFEDDYLVEKDE